MNINDKYPIPLRVITTKDVKYKDGTGVQQTIPSGTVAYILCDGENGYSITVGPYFYERIIKERREDLDVPEDCKSIGVDALWLDEYKLARLPDSKYKTSCNGTTVIVENHCSKKLRDLLYSHQIIGSEVGKNEIVFITDSNLYQVSSYLRRQFEGSAIKTWLFEFPAGEKNKSVESYIELMDRMGDSYIGRDITLIGFGGGVVGDLTGFIASTYMRGVRKLVHIPTTLMAAADSSIGGKTGINLVSGKNLVGTFRVADLVVTDPILFGDLPAIQWWSGVAEILKYGAILSKPLFNRVKQGIFKTTPDLIEIIGQCITMKLGITGNDPYDRRGGRELLNFGHTFGHALEQVAGYGAYTHGAAVGLGMLVAIRCGESVSSVRLLGEMKDALIANGLPISISNEWDEDDLLEAIHRDKKGGKWVLLRDIGDAYTSSVTDDKIREAIADLQTKK